MVNLKKLQSHLNNWMLVYTLILMIAGVWVGYGHSAILWVKANQQFLTLLNTIAVFFIIYPMMVNVKLELLLKSMKNWKALLLSLIYNFAWAPIFGYFIATYMIKDPALSIGFLLVMVVPCSSMSITYTGLAEGDVELSTMIVALSFIAAIFAVPFWMRIFASHTNVPVPTGQLLMSILEVLILPMVLGYLTRTLVVRAFGEEKFKNIQPIFPSISIISMYILIFLIFFSKAGMVVDKIGLILFLLVPNAIFIAVTLIFVTWLNKVLHFSYKEHMAIVFASTGKNNGTAVALATAAFSPMVAIPAATMPIFQIILLILYLKLGPWIKKYYEPVNKRISEE